MSISPKDQFSKIRPYYILLWLKNWFVKDNSGSKDLDMEVGRT